MPTPLLTLDRYDFLTLDQCDFCPSRRRRLVYIDPSTQCRFCLNCLVIAVFAEARMAQEGELPEDPALTAYGRAYIAASRNADPKGTEK